MIICLRGCSFITYEIHKAVIQARILSGKYLTDKPSRHWTKNSLGLCTVGRAEKWKNDIFKCADVDYYGIECSKF